MRSWPGGCRTGATASSTDAWAGEVTASHGPLPRRRHGSRHRPLLDPSINARDAMPHGGRITIEAANKRLDHRAALLHDMEPGEYLSICGTTMCIYLPRHHGGASEDAPTAPSRHLSGQRRDRAPGRRRGDDPRHRRRSDRGAGLYAVSVAADGAAGIRLARSGASIDLLVTDVGLPGGMNGRQVADAIRALRPACRCSSSRLCGECRGRERPPPAGHGTAHQALMIEAQVAKVGGSAARASRRGPFSGRSLAAAQGSSGSGRAARYGPARRSALRGAAAARPLPAGTIVCGAAARHAHSHGAAPPRLAYAGCDAKSVNWHLHRRRTTSGLPASFAAEMFVSRCVLRPVELMKVTSTVTGAVVARPMWTGVAPWLL